MRHLSYFNTEQFWGAGVPGIALALEEQKALGAPITGEMIESVKAGLMGPFAGLGDSINWVTLAPNVADVLPTLYRGGACMGCSRPHGN